MVGSRLMLTLCVGLHLGTGVFAHRIGQVGVSRIPERIGFEEIIVAVKVEISAVAEQLGRTDRFVFEFLFGEVVPYLDGNAGCVPEEVGGELAPLRKIVADG